MKRIGQYSYVEVAKIYEAVRNIVNNNVLIVDIICINRIFGYDISGTAGRINAALKQRCELETQKRYFE